MNNKKKIFLFREFVIHFILLFLSIFSSILLILYSSLWWFIIDIYEISHFPLFFHPSHHASFFESLRLPLSFSV